MGPTPMQKRIDYLVTKGSEIDYTTNIPQCMLGNYVGLMAYLANRDLSHGIIDNREHTRFFKGANKMIKRFNKARIPITLIIDREGFDSAFQPISYSFMDRFYKIAEDVIKMETELNYLERNVSSKTS